MLSLVAGTRLGHYEIIELIGVGGMGAVYKARDPRLNRTVAIKVLLEHISDDGNRRARFEREAQTIAGLNHPHICVVYDVGRHGGTDFLVMELLEGETLARRLERGPLTLDEALKHATKIANALDTAHRCGVTHRDLKPGNVMLTRNGVKLVDFGLAKVRRSPAVSVHSSAGTETALTVKGTILGSLQYMAPEQLHGGEADARTDMFALGAVLYEMVTGRKAFEGADTVGLMNAILNDTPRPASALQPGVPATLDRLIATCLAKDPEARWQSARDVSRELEWIAEGSSAGAGDDSAGTNRSAPHVRRPMPWTAASLIAGIAILITAGAVWMLKPTPSPGQLRVARLALTLEPGELLSSVLGMPAALFPDGSTIVYSSRRKGKERQLYLRPMGSLEAKPVPGTEDAANPFLSPNGQWIGFFAQSKLKRVPVSGGAVETLCEAGSGRGGSWARDDTIYFAPDNSSGLWTVPASGGKARPLTTLDRKKGEVSHRWPQVLPGGKAVLFTVWTGPAWDEAELQLLTLQTGERRALARGARTGCYVATGHLIFSRDGTDTLMATPFDPDRLQLSGAPPVTLAECVRDTSEGGEYAVSDSGTLAYLAGDPQRYDYRLVWVDRKGVIEPLPAPPRAYQEPVISPDGRQVAVSVAGPAYSIWIYNLAPPMLTPLAASGSSQAPIWTPDGKHLVYRATRSGSRDIFWRAANGGGEEERLTSEGNIRTPGSWSPDGTRLFFYDIDRTTSTDVWALRLNGDRKPQRLLETLAAEGNPRISPDGRWLAYVSDESGRSEIWIRPWPKLDAKWKISTEGGTEPVWSRDGRELFYRNGDRMMSVGIGTGATFAAASPRVLFEGRYQYSGTGVSAYDVSPDGRRFLMVQPTESVQPIAQIQIVLNWFEDLKRRVPAK